MNAQSTIVIVGAGLAGAEAAFALREHGYAGRIVLLGKESWPPYDRPPLSKSFLDGTLQRDRLWLRDAEQYRAQDIDLRLGVVVARIDSARREVVLEGGEALGYDKLLLSTGGEARGLEIPGAGLEGVFRLKTLDDAEALSAALPGRCSAVVIGGGYVGMEFAATARQAGCTVTILESQGRVLSRSLSPIVSHHLQHEYERRGVRLMTNTSVARICGDAAVEAVELLDGSRLPADLVLVSVGNQACDELARGIGLRSERGGIHVDRDGRTSHPDVFAAGDCTVSLHDGFESPLRLESVQNAQSQARRAAAAMCSEQAGPDELPWFWSDQFDIKLQMAGLPLPGDSEIVRGDPASGRFSVIYQGEARMTAIQCVNAPSDFVAAKKLIALRRSFPAHLLSDTRLALRELRQHPAATA